MVWSTVTKPVYTAEQQIIALLIENVPKKMFLSVPKNPVDTACCRKQHDLMFRKIPFPPSWVSVQHLKALISLYFLIWLNILLFICSLFYNDDASQRTDNLSVELWSDKSQVSSNAMCFFLNKAELLHIEQFLQMPLFQVWRPYIWARLHPVREICCKY